MRDNPVWRESLDVYFNEGHGFAVYFYILDHSRAGGVFVVVRAVARYSTVERLGEPV